MFRRLRSLIAPLYLITSVAISYLAAFGLSVLIFQHATGAGGLYCARAGSTPLVRRSSAAQQGSVSGPGMDLTHSNQRIHVP